LVLDGSTVTNIGPTVVSGDLGVSPGPALTGFSSPAIVNGTVVEGDANASAAEGDAVTAYNSLASSASSQDMTGQDPGGKTLLPGVYQFDSLAQLPGTLTRARNSSVVTINGISGPTCCNVSWQGGGSATLGTNTGLQGNILTLTRITLTTRANIADGGRARARNGAVTLDTSNIPNAAYDGTSAAEAPEPGTLLLLGAGLIGLVLLDRRSRRRAA
jgi:type VI secretion system secreted protein VgrG